jgi:putative peptidoglycan lipid II flippase
MRNIATAGRSSKAATSARTLIDRLLPRGAILLSVLTFAAYGMGLVRDRIQARTFGAGSELDAYNAAFVVPELLFDVLIAGGLAAPFVPIFMKVRSEDADAADDFGRTVLTLAVLVMVPLAVILFIVAPATVELVASRFDAAQRTLYTNLFRIMCVTPLIFTASIVLGEMLVAKRRFLFYALAPLLYNGGIVTGTLLLSGRIGIYAAAVGAVGGALLHLAIRVVGVLRAGFVIRPAFAVRTAALREFGTLMVPRMAGAPIEPLTFQFFTNIASAFVAGSISSVSFARNFQSVPVSLIAVAFSLAAFPALSAAAAVGNRQQFIAVLRMNVAMIGTLTIAAGALLFVMSTVVIDVLLGGGAFDAEDVHRTALLLSAFAVSVPLESLTYPLARAIYATRNTALPVGASLVGLAVTIVATQLLVGRIGLVAIPLAFAVGSGVKLVLLAAILPLRLRRFPALAAEALSRDAVGASGPR